MSNVAFLLNIYPKNLQKSGLGADTPTGLERMRDEQNN